MDSIFPIRGVSVDVNNSSPIGLSVEEKNLQINYLRGKAVAAETSVVFCFLNVYIFLKVMGYLT